MIRVSVTSIALLYMAIAVVVATAALAYTIRDADAAGPVTGRAVLLAGELGTIWPLTLIVALVAVCLMARKGRSHA